MTENQEKKAINRAVLVGLNAHCLSREENADDSSMEELADLLETAGGVCVGTVFQNKDAPDPRTFIGEGKVAEVKECGFTVETADGAPYFAEADLVLVCKKAYWQDMDPTHFLDGEIDGKWYPEKDYHRIFIGEIETVLKKK